MILEVIVDISTNEIDRTFDYEGEDMPIGSRVSVEFGKKRLIGFVVGKKDSSDCAGLKEAKYLDTPISSEQLELLYFMRNRYRLRYIDVLRLFVPAKLREEKDPESTRIFLALDEGRPLDDIKRDIGARAKKQLEALDFLAAKGGEFLSLMAARFGVAAIDGLRSKGAVKESRIHERRAPKGQLDGQKKVVELTQAQKVAVKSILNSAGTYLLHGVTGSGKTEVYEQVIERMLDEGKTAIMLVPEISLTPQMLGLLRARFGDNVAILHSGLNASERYDEWRRLQCGEAKIAIGARSAIFAPLKNIGVIVIDEEHDSSYQSESNPRYDAKAVAAFRAKQNGARLVLGSATPDIESYLKAMNGEYALVNLPERISRYKLPEMEVVDMVAEFRLGNRGIFSHTLADAIGEALERGEQTMIFLNRRGFASFLRCKECGYIAKCEDCDVSLTYHKEDGELKCHYCGKRYHALTKCPNCGSTEIKHGKVGTEKVVEELKRLYPKARIMRMDNDTTSKKDSYFEILSSFKRQEADILVGTQMIAKGHDFENVTLVGILEADSALDFSDYRATERTFQLITQVAGRAGRADKKGRVVLQTYAPRHYVFRFGRVYDYVGFYKKEINTRLVTKFPPFTQIVRILIAGEDEQSAVDAARKIYKAVRDIEAQEGEFVYLGAHRSPVTKMNGLVRYQVMMRLDNDCFERVMPLIFDVTERFRQKGVNVFAEINPQSLI